ncbi:ABC transporter ATP-binding protein/permease [Aquitalea sp. LB_tupeE]|uniref:ABC transporter ATP-binding protein/permease n=1 Tax=Aquitalea sp. LB_tupeE TaxID=2748078 RepID=UPI0015BC764B|nr:ABC transporter ATP-binding protein/permease [Aquitalea sp. LB_tupeE]NWK76547.1 ABC transporter ATP-binding protein/permease [Aquitalea sp. LB_tupeE]
MDWNQELGSSLVWVAKAYGITCLLFVIAVWSLTRLTSWGRQFWHLSGGYFSLRRSAKPLLAIALILLLTLAGVRLDVVLSNWSNGLYNSLQQLNESLFWSFVRIFCILASLHVLRSLFSFYVNQSFSIHWRAWLNEQLLQRLLNQQAFYRLQYLPQHSDNPDQRIQQDVSSFVDSSLGLSMGVVRSLVSTLAYTLILWNLSGPLQLLGVEIPRAMVFAVFVYVLIATVLAVKIGRPLVRLNFLNEQYNANYRYLLVRLLEYAESIAFYAGEKVEGMLLRSRFGQIIHNNWRIVFRSLKFQGFNLIVSQTAVVFPLIVQAHRFFTKQITLGDLMQTSQAFGTLHDNLSFFRNAYDDFAGYRAVLNRLSGYCDSMREAASLPRPAISHQGKRLALQAFSLHSPAGDCLLDNVSLEIPAGSALLIRGRSGSGKTTLLRSLAGLWPYSKGQITLPASGVMFLSQKPYLPGGSLRDALYYPATPPQGNSAELEQALHTIQLGHLLGKLDEERDWSHSLSLGEQQRLAFGRLLLNKPDIAFLDEASSALDEGLEDAMYRLLREQLPATTLVSVGHRSSLLQYHQQQLQILGQGRWEILTA